MAIDIRATVTCSLGTLISGSLSDDYLQGSGLVKTRGSVEISALITPAVGTAVTFTYTKGGVTRNLPRKLRVLSSFADPFRRTTKVELGCKLTYLNDLKEPVKWTAFDDPENASYTAEDDEIVTLPIAASSVMSECLSKLGLSASSIPLSNWFSVAEFDFGPGYVQVLSDLLVSECYFGYLDTDEVLQVRSLNANGGTGPVFTSSDIVDLGPIGVGQLPGEAVTVSYSTLKLKEPESEEDEDEIAKLNWEKDETIGAPTTVKVPNPFYNNNPFPYPQPEFREFNYTPRTVTITTFDAFDRVASKVTTEYSIAAAIAPSAVQAGTADGSTEFTTVTSQFFFYEVSAANATILEYLELPENYENVVQEITVVSEPKIKAFASTPVYEQARSNQINFAYSNLDTDRFTAEKTVIEYESSSDADGAQITKTLTHRFLASVYAQQNQQSVSNYVYTLPTDSATFSAQAATLLDDSTDLLFLGTEVQIRTGREFGLQRRPSSADRTNAKYAKDGDPNNGWRVESSGELELAVGSATAQRRIELSMPYAPDDRFIGPSGGPFSSVPSDAPQKAQNYGRAQNSLLLGNRNGINLQVAPERMPTAPFDPIYVQASGLTALYRTNGNQWAFDSNGIVCSTDALFWAAVGGTGTFWFPVAPGITTLPAEPPIVDGEMNANNVVLPYNETAIYEGRLRLGNAITKFEYALGLLTAVPALNLKASAEVRRILKVEVPAANFGLAPLTPAVSSGAALRPPVAATTIAAPLPAVVSGASVSIPILDLAFSVLTPVSAGRLSTQIAVPNAALTVTASLPTVISGASVQPPAANTAIAAPAPASVSILDPNFTNVTLLLHMDGSNGSTTITDNSSTPKTFTVYGNAQISTAQSKFGGASLLLDGNGDYLTTPNNSDFAVVNGNAFTIECWAYNKTATGGGVTKYLCRHEHTSGFLAGGWVLAVSGASDTFFFQFGQGSAEAVPALLGGAATYTQNTWHHVAVSYDGTTYRVFMDGTVIRSSTGLSAGAAANSSLWIGRDTSNTARDWDGHIDDLRITKGVARYTAAFTPTTAPFPNQ